MPDTLSLQNKVAIVTGSGRENGIGAGIALALARNGASVVVHFASDSSKTRAAQVCETLRRAGGQAIAVQASLDTVEGAKLLVRKTLEGFNTEHIDILGKQSPRTYCINHKYVLTMVYSQQCWRGLFLPHHGRAQFGAAVQCVPNQRAWPILHGSCSSSTHAPRRSYHQHQLDELQERQRKHLDICGVQSCSGQPHLDLGRRSMHSIFLLPPTR